MEGSEDVKLIWLAVDDMKVRRSREKDLADTTDAHGLVSVIGDGGRDKRSLGHSANSS